MLAGQAELTELALLMNRYHGAKIWIYEMGLVYHFSVPKPAGCPAGSNSMPPPSHPTLIANLTRCVDAVEYCIRVPGSWTKGAASALRTQFGLLTHRP